MCFFSFFVNHSANGAQLEHFSDIKLPDSIVLQCEFSKLSRAQLILVIATRNAAEEMIQFYQYKGVSGFQQLTEHEIRLEMPSNVQPPFALEKRFTLFESEKNILSFMAIQSVDGQSLIEFTYK